MLSPFIWTIKGTKKLWTDGEVEMECQENFKGKTLALSRSIRILSHCTAVAEVICATDMKGEFQVQPIQMCTVNLLCMI